MAEATILARCGIAAGRAGTILAIFALAVPSAATPPSQTDERAYDIAAQDLETALLAFSRVSGIDIVYDRAILKGERSEALRGRFAPPIAVATLLRHSALTHRFTSATAVLILRGGTQGQDGSPATPPPPTGHAQLALNRLKVTTGRMIGQPSTDYRPFGQVVQSTIMRRLQDNSATQSKRFKARLAISIDAQGVIHPLRLESGSGDIALDGEVMRVLEGILLPEAPPEGMPQPIWFDVVQR